MKPAADPAEVGDLSALSSPHSPTRFSSLILCHKMTKVTLHYDIVSPWSFMAYTSERLGPAASTTLPDYSADRIRLLLHAVLKRYKQLWDMQLELKPMFLGGVMQAAGNKPYVAVSMLRRGFPSLHFRVASPC